MKLFLHVMILLMVISLLCITSSSLSIKFLDTELDYQDWKHTKEKMHSLFTKGHWKKVSVHEYPMLYNKPCIHVTKYVHERCADSNYINGIQYIWEPDDGKIERFNHEIMCKAMNGRNLLLLGDSLSEQTLTVFLSAFWNNVLITDDDWKFNRTSKYDDLKTFNRGQCDSFCWDFWPQCSGTHNVDCGSLPDFNITFQWLNPFTNISYGSTDENWSYAPWVQLIEEQNISLIVCNAGAHFIEDEQQLNNIDRFLYTLFEKYPNISTIFRNTVPGAIECEKHFHDAPMTEYPNATYLNIQHPTWHWGDFTRQNKLIHEYLHDRYPQVFFLDAYASGALRVDTHSCWHNDCLHFCLPGPVDDWIHYIYNIVLQMTKWTENDMNRKNWKSSHVLAPVYNSPFSEDSLLRSRDANTVYIVKNKTRHMIPNADTFMSMGLEWSWIKLISQEELTMMPVGDPIQSITRRRL